MKTCSIEGCAKEHYARGWCEMHYARARKYGDPCAPDRRAMPRSKAPPRPCAFDGCERVGRVTKGLCPTHYMRLLRNGDPAVVLPNGKVGEGRVGHPLYRSWSQMCNRCHNPNNWSYPRYGGRGIVVCDRWRDDFLNFLHDMGERPPGMSVDRIDPDGPYAPENCRWATPKTQRNNLSAEGDRLGRQKGSEKRTEYWRHWRIKRGLSPEAPTRAEYRARAKVQRLAK